MRNLKNIILSLALLSFSACSLTEPSQELELTKVIEPSSSIQTQDATDTSTITQTQNIIEDSSIIKTEDKTEQILDPAFLEINKESSLKKQANGAFYINGKTSKNCSSITVVAKNNATGLIDTYQLAEYKYGDSTFKYGIRKDWSNLGAGLNIYSVTAYCDDSQVIEEEVKFNYTPPTSSDAFINLPDVSTLKLSSNNYYYVNGTTSDNCSKIVVEATNESAGINDVYTLEKYKPGDVSFKYGIGIKGGNLGLGTNNYEFTAYCDNEQIITKNLVFTYTVKSTSQNIPSTNNSYYTNVDGNKVSSPIYSNTIPSGASAKCKDGTYSFSQHRSGTCSGHGGVASWL